MLIENIKQGTEIVIGIVAPVGTYLDSLRGSIGDELKKYKYEQEVIKISVDVIKELSAESFNFEDEYQRINKFMDEGDNLREKYRQNEVLALGAVSKIKRSRPELETPQYNKAYIIDSLKTPEEVKRLRQIYGGGFYLIGVYADEDVRLKYLIDQKNVSENNAKKLIARDAHEQHEYGQRTTETFHLSDFFVHWDNNTSKLSNQIKRIFYLIFGNPFITPTFDEYAMYMAFSSALRSADLSRQVGAVIAKDNSILATGANEVPKAGGGQYFPTYNNKTGETEDASNGRDFKRGEDSNFTAKQEIIEEIVTLVAPLISKEKLPTLKSNLIKGKIGDITEYGRMVHAEMDAICNCAKLGISTQDTTLYSTTFPCHNCAKHIISSGVKRVVYVEPYPKSKASKFHDDSICLGLEGKKEGMLSFEPFVGVGPRSFLNLFSVQLGSGIPIERKSKNGKIAEWEPQNAIPRIKMQMASYLKSEIMAGALLEDLLEKGGENQNAQK
jgi:deoxycytidylate deaminase